MSEPTLLNVIIVGNNELNQYFEKQSFEAGLQVSFSFSDKITPSQGENADIIIFMELTPEIAKTDATIFQNSVERILCLREEDEDLFNSLPEEEKAFFTSFWTGSISETLLASLMSALTRSAKEKKNLVLSQIYLDTLINSIPDLVWFKDLRGSHLKVNNAFGKAVGKTATQCEGRGHYYIWDLEPEDYASGEYVCLETEEEVIEKGETCLFDEKVLAKSGLRQFKTYKSPLFNRSGKMIGTTGIAKDVTDLQNLSRELEIILSSLPFATLIADEDNSIVYVNNKFCEYFSVTREEILEYSYPVLCKYVIKVSQEDLLEKDMMEVVVVNESDSKVLCLQQEAIQDIFGNHFGFFLLCLDITKEYSLQNEILHSANTDFLTGLYNRRYFYKEIAERGEKEAISLIYFDLDDFKIVNDTYGHQVGDRALIEMATYMKEAFSDKLIARLGGDEFIIATFSCPNVQILKEQVDEFIISTTNRFRENEQFETISVSAGIAYNDKLSLNVDVLISNADKALYKAKALGKSRSSVYQEVVI